MISTARTYWLLHGLFANAQTLGEVRWINSKFAHETDAMPVELQLRLSSVMERRVTELKGIDHAPIARSHAETDRREHEAKN